MKKLCSWFLAFCMVLSLCPVAVADTVSKGDFLVTGEISGSSGFIHVEMRLPDEEISVNGVQLELTLPKGVKISGNALTELRCSNGKAWTVGAANGAFLLYNEYNEPIEVSNQPDGDLYTLAKVPIKVDADVLPGSLSVTVEVKSVSVERAGKKDGHHSYQRDDRDYFIDEGRDYFEQTREETVSYIKSIADAKISGITTKVYSGQPRTQSMDVTMNGHTLKYGSDYRVSYKNNVNPGKATVTITGVYPGYYGSVNKYFYIVPKMVENFKVSRVTVSAVTLSWQSVTGADGYEIYRSNSKTSGFKLLKAVSGQSKTTYSDSGLLSGTSYYYKIAAYKKIDGKNRTGTSTGYRSAKTQGYKLKTVSGVSALKQTTSSITLKWKVSYDADGYVIYRSTSATSGFKAIKTIKKAATTSFKDTKLSAGKTYYYRVAATRTYKGATGYGAYASLTTATAPKAPATPKAYNSAKKSAKVSWKKVSGASGYKLYMSTKKNSGFKAVYTGSKLTYQKKSLKKGKTYYFKVRAYRTVGSKKIYGAYSKTKSLKAKK